MTLSGVIKELITIYLGILIYGDDLNLNTWLGAGVIIIGVLYYSHLKWVQAKTPTSMQGGDGVQGELVLVGGEDLVRFELLPMETELELQLEALEDEHFFMPVGGPSEDFLDDDQGTTNFSMMDVKWQPSHTETNAPSATKRMLDKGKEMLHGITGKRKEGHDEGEAQLQGYAKVSMASPMMEQSPTGDHAEEGSFVISDPCDDL